MKAITHLGKGDSMETRISRAIKILLWIPSVVITVFILCAEIVIGIAHFAKGVYRIIRHQSTRGQA